MRGLQLLTLAACCGLASLASADTGGITPIVEFSAGYGGDPLAELTFTDGDTQEIRAGTSYDASNVMLRVAFGYR